jgi:Mrp family chromosome partitioning ATPase
MAQSSVTTQLALSLGSKYRVGVLDIDLCGPSLPRMFGVPHASILQSSQGYVGILEISRYALSICN